MRIVRRADLFKSSKMWIEDKFKTSQTFPIADKSTFPENNKGEIKRYRPSVVTRGSDTRASERSAQKGEMLSELKLKVYGSRPLVKGRRVDLKATLIFSTLRLHFQQFSVYSHAPLQYHHNPLQIKARESLTISILKTEQRWVHSNSNLSILREKCF